MNKDGSDLMKKKLNKYKKNIINYNWRFLLLPFQIWQITHIVTKRRVPAASVEAYIASRAPMLHRAQPEPFSNILPACDIFNGLKIYKKKYKKQS